MSKLVLNNVSSGYTSTTVINSNNDAIETAIENTLSRDGTSPNQMLADLDMNGNRILNALSSTANDEFISKGDWTTATTYVINNYVYVPVGTGSSYDGFSLQCKVTHTSGILNTDYSDGKWIILAARGASGGGSGDLVSTNNLSDVADTTTARGNLLAAKSGVNSDITNLTGLTTALSITQGGTGQTTAAAAAQDLLDGISTTQGDILYNNGTDWVVLSAGTSGYFLKTNGAAANPEWAVGSPISGTAIVASGTTVNFTSIPSSIKRLTVLFSGLSGNGTSPFLIQIGTSSGVTTSGYKSAADQTEDGSGGISSTAGFVILGASAVPSTTYSGIITLINVSGNIWVSSGNLHREDGALINPSAGSVTLSGTLDRVRVTTVNGTDSFDAGTINILYE